jgi:hypothetical protein
MSTVIVGRADENELISFYFHKDGLANLNSVNNVNADNYGKYELKAEAGNEMRRAAGNFIFVDETGIYVKKNKLLNISREEVRENPKYSVNDNYIHGVIENDSLPVALDGELYYFLVPAKTYLIETPVAINKLVQISKAQYALFTLEENGHFSVVVADFSSGGIELKEVVLLATGESSIEKIVDKKLQSESADGIKTFILTPTKEEWMSIIFGRCLKTYDAYSKVS